jgi:hypothetical protein
MSGQALRRAPSYACAYCGEPLVLTSHGIAAWREGNEFVCNEFCADGITPKDDGNGKAPTATARLLKASSIVAS